MIAIEPTEKRRVGTTVASAGLGSVFLLAACGAPVADRASPDLDLPTGHWTVVARAPGATILAHLTEHGRAARRPESRATPPSSPPREFLRYSPDGTIEGIVVEEVPITLPGVPAERSRPLAVGRSRLGSRVVHVDLPGWAPALIASPSDPGLLLFEEANTLWLLTAGGEARRITADRVGDFEFETLAERQREGEVILYWAAAPVWAPDGARIAYVTNREAVASGHTAQAIWLLEVGSGRERPLVTAAGQWFSPVGWLGAELLYTGSEGGVRAVDPTTARTRQVAMGVPLHAANDGSALAVAEGPPDSIVIRVHSSGGVTVVPPPEGGFTYATQANFSPDGARLLLVASADGGMDRQVYTFDWRAEKLHRIDLDPGKPALALDWPSWIDGESLLFNLTDPSTGENRALVVRSP